jgi:hypothetical protein
MQDFFRYQQSLNQAISDRSEAYDRETYNAEANVAKQEARKADIESFTNPLGFELTKSGAVDVGKQLLKKYGGKATKQFIEDADKNGLMKTTLRKLSSKVNKNINDLASDALNRAENIKSDFQGFENIASSSEDSPQAMTGLNRTVDNPAFGLDEDSALGSDVNLQADSFIGNGSAKSAPMLSNNVDYSSFASSDPFKTDSFTSANNELIDQLSSKPGGASTSDIFNALLKIQTNAGYKQGSGLLSDHPALGSNTASGKNVMPKVADLQSKLNLTPGEIPDQEGNKIIGMRVQPSQESENASSPNPTSDNKAPTTENSFNDIVSDTHTEAIGDAQVTADSIGGVVDAEDTVGSSISGAIDDASGAISGATDAIDGLAEGAGLAAAGEGGLDPIADVVAIGAGLASLFGGIFGSKVKHPTEVPLPNIITQGSFGIQAQ